jgi:hypothetical protein
MREYERGTKVNNYTRNPWYYEILKHECGIDPYKSGRYNILFVKQLL